AETQDLPAYEEKDLTDIIKCMTDCECCYCNSNNGNLVPGSASCGKFEIQPREVEVPSPTGSQKFISPGKCASNACTCDVAWQGPEMTCTSHRFDKSFNQYVKNCKPESSSEVCLLFKQYVENMDDKSSKWGKFDARFGMGLQRAYL
uniref:Uncharacterized protein n=1 Tax=Acrobeloides nanus TaxID=290746 RepID=A0A914DCT1_9BILA